MKNIYLDNAATTPIRKEVIESMMPFFDKDFGNPSSFHLPGKKAKDAIETARQLIAKNLNCRISEIIFTAGGTESDNLAILGFARANKKKGKHIIVSKIEHPAVLQAVKKLSEEGFDVDYLPVDKKGIIRLEELKKLLKKDTILVSVMYANNEIGTIQPISEIAKILRNKTSKKNTGFPVLHTDACQAAGALDMDVLKLGVDMLTFNGSKIYGPKGIGALYVKKGLKIEPIVFGGGQEYGIRGGTENVSAIVGMAKAFDLAQKEKNIYNKKLSVLRDYLIAKILKNVKGAELNGDAKLRLSNNVNISIPRVEGEAMVLYLDSKGIYVATGSACSSNSLEPSHVLLAIGRSHQMAHNSLRFSLGRQTKKEDLDYLIAVLPKIVKKLTEISAL